MTSDEKQEALLITTYPDKKNDDKIEEGVERDLIEMIAGL